MNNKELIDIIINTEEEYLKNFCTIEKFDDFTRYKDDDLKDMYDYNCILINKSVNPRHVYEIIENEKKHRKAIGSDFCRIFTEDKPCFEDFDKSYRDIEIEHNGYYVYKAMVKPDWKSLNNCKINKVDNSDAAQDFIDKSVVDNDPGNHGYNDFCLKRAKHHVDVYMDEKKPLNCYLCYYDNIPAGHCELMIKDGIAKIEDFMVLDKYQRRGIGRTIMNYLLNKALDAGVELIYLVADEDDTPKEMYINMGFEKVYDRYAMKLDI